MEAEPAAVSYKVREDIFIFEKFGRMNSDVRRDMTSEDAMKDHQFESNTKMFLKKGYAVASVDYRISPPNVWADACNDVRGCIRYLKAHSGELGLDPEVKAAVVDFFCRRV